MNNFISCIFLLFVTSLVWSKCPDSIDEWEKLRNDYEKKLPSKGGFSQIAKETNKIPDSVIKDRSIEEILSSSEKSRTRSLLGKERFNELRGAVDDVKASSFWRKCSSKFPEEENIKSLGDKKFNDRILKCMDGIENTEDKEYLESKYHTIKNSVNDYLRKIKPFDLDSCFKEVTDQASLICISPLRQKIEKEKRKNVRGNFMGMNISDEDYFKANSEIMSVESIPEPLRSKDFLNEIGRLESVDKAIMNLEKQLKGKEPIIYKSNTLHPGIALDGLDERLVVNINENGCNKTYILSLPSEKARKPKQMGFFGICNNDPKTGKKLDEPIQFIGDYWRVYKDGDVSVGTRFKDRVKGEGETCISCHTNGPILIRSEENKNSASSLEKEEIVNNRFKSFSKAKFVSYDNKEKTYIETFNQDYKRSLGVPYGPIKKYDDEERNFIVENCVPKNISNLKKYYGKSKDSSRKRLKSYISEAMNCTKCHNKHQQGELHNTSIPIVTMQDYFLREDYKHEMPPGISESFPKEDIPLVKKYLLGCIDVEKNGKENLNYIKNLDYLDPEQQNNLPRKEIEKRVKEESEVVECKKNEDYGIASLLGESCNKKSDGTINEDFSKDLLKIVTPKGAKAVYIPDIVASSDMPPNNIAYCDKGKIYFPLFTVPGCSGSCHPFRATLEFDKNGEFLGIGEKFCDDCESSPIQKYGHIDINSSEKKRLESFMKSSINDRGNNTAYMEKTDFVDALTGATKSVGFPVDGLGESTYLLNKYGKAVSDFVRNNSGLCD